MGKASRDKGLRRERALVEIHTKCGIHAERVPLSGASHYQGNGGDLDIYARGRGAPPYTAEVKARGNGSGFKLLAGWLAGHDALFLWQDRAAPLVVLPLHVWLELLSFAAPANDQGSIQPDPDAETERLQRRTAAEQGRPVDAVAERAA
ncbi:hypothetical protein [Falsiroseomonas oryzae]|uniref:hypothetical protein n=1 Tax=Falsiroseomonas oryzae TaxID=2766473 RepID=UPI0022EA3645|nr:hypothetical protein [Roseomonas sp. MO-31]